MRKRFTLVALAVLVSLSSLVLVSLSEVELGELPVEVVLSEIGDGSRILYIGSVPVHTPDQIYSVNIDGTDIQQHTSECTHETPETTCYYKAPSVSPDGTRLAYEMLNFEVDGVSGIYTVNLDGTDSKFLVPKGKLPTWSPDGKRIAFVKGTSDRPGNSGFRSELFVVNADGTGERQITDLNGGYFPTIPDRSSLNDGRGYVFEVTDTLSWSPDGKRIVFDSGLYGNIYTVNVDGDLNSGLTPLLDPEDDRFSKVSWAFGNSRFVAENPSWSPDGQRIAFDVRNKSNNSDEEARKIYTINPDGTDAVHVANGHYPTWSPDSQYLLFWNVYDILGDGKWRNWFYRKADGSPTVGAVTRNYYATFEERFVSFYGNEHLSDLPRKLVSLDTDNRPVWYQPALTGDN